jgi:hypothetical protein
VIQEHLMKTLDGDVLVPADPGYDAARAVWNAMVDRRPRLIARCRPVADDRLIIDLTPMGAVRVDPIQKRAWVQGGALLGALDRATQPVRRAYPPDKLARLTALKDRYDPDNVFHLNHNIRPSASAGSVPA